jgi:hypothetical protein
MSVIISNEVQANHNGKKFLAMGTFKNLSMGRSQKSPSICCKLLALSEGG